MNNAAGTKPLSWPDNLLKDISAEDFAPFFSGAKRPMDFDGSLEYALCSLRDTRLINPAEEYPNDTELRSMSPEQAVRLHYHGGLSIEEISAQLSVPEITVRHAIDLSLKHLRQLFFIEILCIGIKAHTEYASTAAWRLGYKHGLEVPADCTDTLADDPEEIITPPEQILNVDPTTPVESLNLSRRCLNILKRANIYTVYELISRPEEDFVKIRNIGHSTIVEVKSALQRNGFDFGCVQFSSIREQ